MAFQSCELMGKKLVRGCVDHMIFKRVRRIYFGFAMSPEYLNVFKIGH